MALAGGHQLPQSGLDQGGEVKTVGALCLQCVFDRHLLSPVGPVGLAMLISGGPL